MAAQVQAHGNVKAVAELAAQIALATRWPADMIAQALLSNERTLLASPMCSSACAEPGCYGTRPITCAWPDRSCAPGETWTLSGEILAVEQEHQA